MDATQLERELIEAINNELDLCDFHETPIICNMKSDKETREMLVKEIEKRVLQQHIDIAYAIVQIDNEYNPNTLD